MRPLAAALAMGASACALAASAASKPLPGPAEVSVANPFATTKALAAFQKYLAEIELNGGAKIEVPPEFWDVAPTMTYWGYRFVPNGETYDVLFAQRYDAKPVLQSMVNVVGGLRDDGCSFYHATNPRITSISLKKVRGEAGIEGKQRACGEFLGQEWKTDVGDISGNASAELTFYTAMSGEDDDRFRGKLIANDPSANVHGNVTSIFGINTNSVVGQLATAVFTRPLAAIAFVKSPNATTLVDTLNVFSDKAFRYSANPTMAFNLADETKGATSSKRYRQFLQALTDVTQSYQASFAIEDGETGLIGSVSNPALSMTYKATIIDTVPVDVVYADVEEEIRVIKSFGDDPQTVTVAKGNTLSGIAKRYYENPYYWALIAAENGLSRKAVANLKVGQTLTVPPRYTLALVKTHHFVAAGETAASICKTLMPTDAACLKKLRAANPGVNLSLIYALEPLRLPR